MPPLAVVGSDYLVAYKITPLVGSSAPTRNAVGDLPVWSTNGNRELILSRSRHRQHQSLSACESSGRTRDLQPVAGVRGTGGRDVSHRRYAGLGEVARGSIKELHGPSRPPSRRLAVWVGPRGDTTILGTVPVDADVRRGFIPALEPLVQASTKTDLPTRQCTRSRMCSRATSHVRLS